MSTKKFFNPFDSPNRSTRNKNNDESKTESSNEVDLLGDMTLMNSRLGLHQSYIDNTYLERSDLDVSRSQLNRSNINRIDQKLLGDKIGSQREGADTMQWNFDFNSHLGLDIGLLNDFDEHAFSEQTGDTRDLSHMSIQRFKDNFYQKDNTLYLDITALNQSNINGINRSQNRTQDRGQGKSLNKSAMYAGNTSNNRGNQAPNPQNRQ